MRLSLGLALACGLLAQEQQEPPVLFRERVNLVTVPVVVRDRKGQSVGSLKQEDFQLFDRGKLQVISRFSVETSKSTGKAAEAAAATVTAAPSVRAAVPERYVAYLFDDLHLEFGDLARVRDAAWEHMDESLAEGDRAAIFTTSGQTIAEFTDDKDALHATLLKLMPRPTLHRSSFECPDMGHYQADLILNRMDTMAFQAAVGETMMCARADRRIAEAMVRAAASRAAGMAEQGTRVALSTLRDVVRRMAAAPGQRVILLASPGFVATEDNMTRNEIVDRAIKANVTINGLDARGLWVDSMFDVSKPYVSFGNGAKSRIESEGQRRSADIVADLAHGTGGTFFQNSNDLAGGYRKLAEMPEHVYVLGFSPEDLKLDGTFHSLKVQVKREEKQEKLTASARRGYYAPKQQASVEDSAKEEIREAVFSRQEARAVPLEVKAAGERSSDGNPQLTVAMRVPLKSFRYKIVGDRHTNSVTLVHAIFDRNGQYVTGEENTVELKLQPGTLEKPDAAMTARKAYAMKPGVYSVRVVVRDSEERNLSTANATVEVR
jgi:VWFA-related protein